MNTKIGNLLLSSACAIGICGVAMAQNMNPAAAPQPTDQAMSASTAQEGLPVDQETTVSGVQVMCGGIGSDESDPRYANYPAKIEAAGGYGQWLGDNDITIAGAQNVSTHCRGPWFMAQLQPGSYTVTVKTRHDHAHRAPVGRRERTAQDRGAFPGTAARQG